MKDSIDLLYKEYLYNQLDMLFGKKSETSKETLYPILEIAVIIAIYLFYSFYWLLIYINILFIYYSNYIYKNNIK